MSQRQCLPINDEELEESSDDEMEYDVTQISALKYLQKVRSQRNRIPQIVTSTVPVEYEITSSVEVVSMKTHENILEVMKDFISRRSSREFPMNMIQQKNGKNCRLKISQN